MDVTTPDVMLSTSGVESEMWNFYSGVHPSLNDNYMDPPSEILIPSNGVDYPHCDCKKDKEAFKMYYGSKTFGLSKYTSPAMVDVGKQEKSESKPCRELERRLSTSKEKRKASATVKKMTATSKKQGKKDKRASI